MRPSWLSLSLPLCCLLSGACAGGQTGEITEPTICDDVAATVAWDGLADGERDRTLAALSAWSGELSWDEDETTTLLHVSAARVEAPVERIGSGACVGIRIPIELVLQTDDERIDHVLSGSVEVRGTMPAILTARAAVDVETELDWMREMIGPTSGAELYVLLDRDGERSNGQLYVAPNSTSGSELDEIRIASW